MNRNYQIKLFFLRETPPQSNCGISRFIVVTVSLEVGWGEKAFSSRGLELQAASCRCFFHLLNCHVRILYCTLHPRYLYVNVLRTYFSFFIYHFFSQPTTTSSDFRFISSSDFTRSDRNPEAKWRSKRGAETERKLLAPQFTVHSSQFTVRDREPTSVGRGQ